MVFKCNFTNQLREKQPLLLNFLSVKIIISLTYTHKDELP